MRHRNVFAAVASCFVLGLTSAPVGATTLMRASLEKLTSTNELVVHAKVIGTRSYWNDDHTFILTDVHLNPIRVLKGAVPGRDLVVTILGGRVDRLTTLIIGGAELSMDQEYVLFLNRQNLPGAPGRLSVRDHVQGVFGVVEAAGYRRAVSQAARKPLVPDAGGISDPPGGSQGFTIEELAQRVRALGSGR